MTQSQAGAVRCPDCGREVPPGVDLCECGYPLMFLRRQEQSAETLKPSRRPHGDDDTDELPVVVVPQDAVTDEPVAPLASRRGEQLVCAACGEVNPTTRTWCAQCGEQLRTPVAVRPVPAAAPPRRLPVVPVVTAVLGVLLVVGAVVLTVWLLDRRDAGPSADGEVQELSASVSASSTATPGTESTEAGRRQVVYDADNVLDGVLATAWRTPGDGRGEALTFVLDGERLVTRVGLVPGYAKDDPATKEDRFLQNRRITAVRWVFDGGASYEQVIEQPSRTMAVETLPEPVRTTAVRLEIAETTEAPARDNTAISEVLLEGR